MESSMTLLSAQIQLLVRICLPCRTFSTALPRSVLRRGKEGPKKQFPPSARVSLVPQHLFSLWKKAQSAFSRSQNQSYRTGSANMIHFKDTQLALIHIPLHLYRNFLQSILQLVLPSAIHPGYANANGAVQPPKGWPYEHPFINISITPVECSVVCSRRLAEELFAPVLDTLDAQSRAACHITSEDFVVMQVDGEGLDAGQRVLDLTSPLALAGM